MSALEDWSPEQVKQAMDKGECVLIDVRTPQEFALEYIEGALLMPMAFFDADALPTQDGKRIVLLCGSGIRSGKTGARTIAAGVEPLAHMEGGFAAWKKSGFPYIGTDMVSGAPKRIPED